MNTKIVFSVGDKAILTDEYIDKAVVIIQSIHENTTTFRYLVSTDYSIVDNKGISGNLDQYPARESELRPLTKLEKALT